MKVVLNIPLLFLATLLVIGCSKDPDEDSIYLAANGVTIKCDATGMVGDTFKINEATYTIVDETMLREMVSQGADLTTVCTSRVTNMSYLFHESQFNQDISSWDVSNVTDMGAMFNRSPFNQDIGSWDVSNVTEMSAMFRNSSFSRDINSWNVANVTNPLVIGMCAMLLI